MIVKYIVSYQIIIACLRIVGYSVWKLGPRIIRVESFAQHTGIFQMDVHSGLYLCDPLYM